MRIEVQDLAKTYPGGKQALAGVSLTIDRGLFGLLGPNGAGKTTLMKIVCTLLRPSTGLILVDGQDAAADRNRIRDRLGYLGQEWGAPKGARCWEVLDLSLRLKGVTDRKARREQVDRLLDTVGLAESKKKKVKTLSGGMLRRLGVAQALAGEPELLVMDEPTVGLDPNERVDFRNLLTHLGRERSVVLSTHIVADVGTTCERVAVLDRGALLFEGAPGELAQKAQGRVFEAVVDAAGEERLRRDMTVVSAVPTAEGTLLRVVGTPVDGVELTPVEPTLEDAYLIEVPEAHAETEAEAA